MTRDLKKTSKNVPEAPTVTDSDDLESQLCPGGDVAESILCFFLDPGGNEPSEWVALGVPSGADPAAGIPGPAPGIPDPADGVPDPALNGSQTEAQSDISGVIFR